MQTDKTFFKSILALSLVILLNACQTSQPKEEQAEDPIATARANMLERADSLELDTPYEAPPGDPLEHHTSGYAKVVCSAVFITGLDPEFAAANIGGFSSPFEERTKVGKPVVDFKKKSVSITLPNGVVRTAVYLGDQSQGCLTLPVGIDKPFYKPTKIKRNLPDPEKTPWPMGDVLPTEPMPAELDMDKVQQAVDAAFEGDGMTAAFVVTYRGRIIGERYGEGITKTTPLESWSMGKSLTATMLGVLINQGVYTLDQPAPIPEWQKEPNDPRAQIRIKDILHMSSGLRFRAPQDPDFDPSLGYPDHLYVYTGSINSFQWAATRPQQWPPNSVGRYRNSDPVLTNYLVRLGVEGRGGDYHSFPQRELFDKIGVRNLIMEADPYGNFLTQGYEFGAGRDWARLGNLYLQDGVWNGERILPEGFTEFVSTLAEPWVKDGRPIYGGFFWINGDGGSPIPREAYSMLGAGGQSTTIIPSKGLVVVRLGHYKGAEEGAKALDNAYTLLMQAVPDIN